MHYPSSLIVVAIPHLEQHIKLATIAKACETQCNEKGTACTDRPISEQHQHPLLGCWWLLLLGVAVLAHIFFKLLALVRGEDFFHLLVRITPEVLDFRL